MVNNSILSEIRELQRIITETDQGVHLTNEHQKKIIDWSKDSAVLSKISILKDSGKVIEGPNKEELLCICRPEWEFVF